MIGAWITWIIVMIVSFGLFVNFSTLGFFLLLIVVVAVPFIAALINFVIPVKTELKVAIKDNGEKNETVICEIKLLNKSMMFYRQVRGKVYFENLLTGENTWEEVRLTLQSKGSSVCKVRFKSSNCGNIKISCDTFKFYDHFGLIGRNFEIPGSKTMQILPEIYPISVSVGAKGWRNEENEQYAERIGEDYSEVYDYRDYEKGDSLNHIQWKLSEKHDRLIVKRGSFPIDQSVMLFVDMSEGINPICNASLVEALISISESLCEGNTSHMIAWMDESGDSIIKYEIENETDLMLLLPQILSIKPSKKGLDMSLKEMETEHIVWFTTNEDYSFAENLDNTTVILSGDSDFAEDKVIGFTSETLAESLDMIVI